MPERRLTVRARRAWIVFVTMCASPFAGGCFSRPMVPPSTPLVAETAETVAPRGVALGISETWGSWGLLSPMTLTTSASTRFGVGPDLEFQGAATAFAFLDDETPEHRAIYAGRLGVKRRLGASFALVSGLGGGVAPAAGGFFSVDQGGIVAYEGRITSPFRSARIFYGIPIRPNELRWDDPTDDTAAPADTFGWSIATGVAFWLHRPPPECVRWRLTVTAAALQLFDGRAGVLEERSLATFAVASLGLEARLWRSPRR